MNDVHFSQKFRSHQFHRKTLTETIGQRNIEDLTEPRKKKIFPFIVLYASGRLRYRTLVGSGDPLICVVKLDRLLLKFFWEWDGIETLVVVRYRLLPQRLSPVRACFLVDS